MEVFEGGGGDHLEVRDLIITVRRIIIVPIIITIITRPRRSIRRQALSQDGRVVIVAGL